MLKEIESSELPIHFQGKFDSFQAGMSRNRLAFRST